MKRILSIVGLTAAAFCASGAIAVAAPSNISQTVGVCDPSFPQRCLKPAADGSIAVTGAGGSGGTSSTYGAAFPTTGTAIGFKNSAGTLLAAGNLDASGNLNVNVAAGSAANAAASATGSAVPASAGYTGVNIGGTLRGMTGLNPTGTVYAGATDTTSVNGVTVLTGTGAVGTGAQRIAVGTDTATIAGSAPGTAGSASANVVTVQGIAAGTPLIQNQTQVNSVAISTGAGATGTGTQRVGVAQDTTTIAGAAPGTAGVASANVLTVQGVASMTKLLVTPDSVALPANQSVNLSQVNAVTVLTGTGATGTGAQRVTVATDTATIAGSAVGTAGTASSNVVTVQGIASGTPLIQNQTQVNSVAISTGTGAVGTGSQRVAVGTDTATIAGSAPGTAGSASANVLTIQGVTSMTPVQVSQATAGNLNATATLAAGSAIAGKFGIDQTTPGTTNAVQLTGDGFTATNDVSGVITSPMTVTTSTVLVAAPGASLRNYITHIACYNTHATVSTLVNVQDGSGGTTIYQLVAPAAYGGSSLTLPVPIRQPTTNTGLYVVNATTGASTTCSASGYKGT